MGRNANGLLKSNTDKGALTVGQLGLHPKAIKMFENPISGWLWEYLRLSANSVILGRYKERLLHQGGLASDIVESYAVQRAKRILGHQIVKHLKKNKNG